MTTCVLNPPGGPIEYRDRKRYAWLLSVVAPLVAPAGPWLYLQTGQSFWLWIFLAFVYLGLPLLDSIFGEDRSNPPESAGGQLPPLYRLGGSAPVVVELSV
ncbi:MAG: hypothetical protein ACOY41_03225 [Pseudomonadota bacterium]